MLHYSAVAGCSCLQKYEKYIFIKIIHTSTRIMPEWVDMIMFGIEEIYTGLHPGLMFVPTYL